jgi:beta-xylosidase
MCSSDHAGQQIKLTGMGCCYNDGQDGFVVPGHLVNPLKRLNQCTVGEEPLLST